MLNKDKFEQSYFEKRQVNHLVHGKDLSWLKYPFWDWLIKKEIHSGRLLDIGCAEGMLLKWAEKRGYQAVGMDISQFAIKKLASKPWGKNLVVGDICSLPFTKNYFDVVTCFDVLEHLPSPEIGISEMCRILKNDGLLFISVPNTSSQGKKWKGNDWFGYRDSTHVSLLSSERWAELLSTSGMAIDSCFYDTLWDSPYLRHIPTFIQHAFFKTSLLLVFWTSLKMPARWAENLYLIARKRQN